MLVRKIATLDRRFLLLAPPFAALPHLFRRVTRDADRHRRLVAEMQRVRGSVYLADGYVRRQELSPDGRHQSAEDSRSWHLLMTDPDGSVSSCAWYLEHENTTTIAQLRIGNCPLARVREWRDKLHRAVESEIGRARQDGLRYAEVGGWAVSAARRSTSDGLLLALAAYGLSRILGGALGITTANVAHASASILRRLGGSYLEATGTPLPAYFDTRYNAMVELLRFDSRQPSAKYGRFVDLLKLELLHVPVIAALAPCRRAAQQPRRTRESWTAGRRRSRNAIAP